MFARAAAALLALTIVRPLWAAPGDITQVPAPMMGAAPPQAKDIFDGDASVSTQTGAFQYAYPIAVPPGRMGMQPSLSLNYSSQAPNYGGVAMGWTLSVPEIKLDISRSFITAELQGQAFGDGLFISTMAGGRPLVEVAEPGAATEVHTFRVQNDGSFARYEQMEATSTFRWRVLTLDGTTHYFGDAALAPASTFAWVPLTRTVDSFGNTIEYEWAGTDLQVIRYTSNPAAGLPAFARVEFERTDGPICEVGLQPVGAQEDRPRGIVQGTRRLDKIRAIAQLPGGPVEHTREISLIYSEDHERCDKAHAPMRVLTGIQESAWGLGARQVDLPPVKFDYNRFYRTFDESNNFGNAPWYEDPVRDSLSWGTRSPNMWPTLNGMLLDFDGDGLLDRLFSAEPLVAGNECMIGWQRNRGRNAQGALQFDAAVYQTLPRLPWKGGSAKDPQEWCSLSSQLTMVTNKTVGTQTPCQTSTGTYLVYRWLDMTSDGLPDLVTAIHHDPHSFDPNASDWFGEWPSCSPAPACPALSASCMKDIAVCPTGASCLLDQAVLEDCTSDASLITCDHMMRPASSHAQEDCAVAVGSDIDPNWCIGSGYGPWHEACPDTCAGPDRISPPENGDNVCTVKTPQTACDRYPWMIYRNLGNGQLSTTAQIKYQPIPLESDDGDSSFTAGNINSTRHAVQDIDGDGNVDAIVRGRYTEQDLDIPFNLTWWLVFPGDGNGNFLTAGDGWPYVWMAPSRAALSGSCASIPGGVCSMTNAPLIEVPFHDVRGISTVIDVNGDRAADLVWKFAPSQFSEPFDPNDPADSLIWDPIDDDDPVFVYAGTARQFEFRGHVDDPEGTAFSAGGVHYFSRSLVEALAYTQTGFMSEGVRQSKARLVDFDADGRPDVIASNVRAGQWDEQATLFVNGGGVMLRGAGLGALSSIFEQKTIADMTGPFPHLYRWRTNKDLVDLDGDGVLESWDLEQGISRRDASTQPLHLMKHIDNGRGTTVDIVYASSNSPTVVQDASQRKATPSPMWVVQSMTTRDAWNDDIAKTSYQYFYPEWNRSSEEEWGFRGFKRVETELPSMAKSVDTFGYDVDWSGRLTSNQTYEAEDLSNPRRISETTWESRTLFSGAITTFHPTHERSWLCMNGQPEAACKASNSGLQHKMLTYQQLPLTGERQVYYQNQTYVMDGAFYDSGDRRAEVIDVLYSDATNYRMQETFSGTAQLNASLPWSEMWTTYALTSYDLAFKHRISVDSQFDLIDSDNHAVVTWTYDAATGVMLTEQAPNNFPHGPVTTYAYDVTRRFATVTTNELGQVLERGYNAGTGAKLWERGPNVSSCGASCTNYTQTWSDSDGLGRSVATYVNVPVAGAVLWQKTLVGRVVYTDKVLSGARTKVVAESRIDYGSDRWTREETRFDGNGRSVEIIAVTGGVADATTKYVYDRSGNLVTALLPDPSGNSAAIVGYTYAYDSLGRPRAMHRPAVDGMLSSGITLTYDGLVHIRREIAGDQGGVASLTKLIHDGFGRLTEVREYTNVTGQTFASTKYAYDARDMVRRIENPDGAVTELFHDMGKRRVRVDRAGKSWSFGYLPGGQLEWESAPAPDPTLQVAYTTTYAYDELGRAKSRDVGARELSALDLQAWGVGTITFAHDSCANGKGRLCAVVHPGGIQSTSYEYDVEGNTAKETHRLQLAGIVAERATLRTYGPGGKVVSQTYADNTNGGTDATRVLFDYDDRGLPHALSWVRDGGAGTLTVATHSRNVAGLVTERRTDFASPGWHDYRSTFTYDALARVTSQTVKNEINNPLVRQQISYFGNDDPSRMRHWMGASYYDMAFDYDDRHQLASIDEAADRFDATYQFTPAGKLHLVEITADSSGSGADVIPRDVYYAYDSPSDPEAVSALHHKADGAIFQQYEYDSVGNMTSREGGDIRTTYMYDGEDQLRRATVRTAHGEVVEEYYYDHSGQRTAIVTRGYQGTVQSVRLFLGDTELLLDASGALQASYAYLSLGSPVGRIADRAEVELQYQGLSQNVLLSVAASGARKSAFVYAPYGEVLEVTGDNVGEQHRRFNDKYRDDATGLSYYGARYYDSTLLGWTQADPLYRFLPERAWHEPRLGLLYHFTMANPLAYFDPDGRERNRDAPYGCFGQPCGRVRAMSAALYPGLSGGFNMSHVQAQVDMASLADPTPLSDVISGGISAWRGDETGAALSGMSVLLAMTVIGDEIVEAYKAGRSVEKAGRVTIVQTVQEGQKHFSVKVEHQGVVVHTEQLRNPITKETHIADAAGDPAPVVRTMEIAVPDAPAAMAYQRKVMDKPSGPYDATKNSCLTHCADVARAAGLSDAPKDTMGFARYLLTLGSK